MNIIWIAVKHNPFGSLYGGVFFEGTLFGRFQKDTKRGGPLILWCLLKKGRPENNR